MHHTAAWPCQNKRLCTGHFSRHGANISYLKSEVRLVQISMNVRVEMSEWRPWVSGGVSLLIFLFCQCVCVPVSVSGRAVNITAETGNRKKEFNTCTQHCGPQLWQQTTQRPLRPNKRSVTTVKPPARRSDSAHTEQEAAPKANVTAQVCGGGWVGEGTLARSAPSTSATWGDNQAALLLHCRHSSGLDRSTAVISMMF